MITVPGAEIAGRLVALQGLLSENGVDAAVIRQNADLYYFTGTVQDAHLVVPASGVPALLVRRSLERAESQTPLRPITPLRSMKELAPAVFEACGTSRPERIGMELDVLPANSFFFYDEKIFPKQQIVDVSSLIKQLRMVKSGWEIELMRGAAAISRAIADAVPGFLREGITELELSAELEAVARKAGNLGVLRLRTFNLEMYFGHVLSGPEAAAPSYNDSATGGLGFSPAFGQGPGRRKITAGEVVSIDTMVSCHGYLNDQTRNFAVGFAPPRLLEAYDLARRIHEDFRSEARPGRITGELYSRVLEWVDRAGWSDYFMGYGEERVSFVGHGLGLEVDEHPFIALGQKPALREGMTVAFEPKFIVPGAGVAGLENTYLVTSTGLESLNTASEELTVI